MTVEAGRPFVDRRVDDLDAAGRLATSAATVWGCEPPVLLRHGMSAIFRSGDVVLRVSRPSAPATAGIELAHVLDGVGIRGPRPRREDALVDGDLAVTCWEYIVEDGRPVDWVEVGRMVQAVQTLAPDRLPAEMPCPSPAAFPWWDFDSLLASTVDAIDAEAVDGLRSVIDRERAWHDFDETVVCHGDVHPGNVMMTADGPVLIDWDLLCRAPGWWDHTALLTWTERWGGEPGLYDSFARGYGWSARGDRRAEGAAELRLVAATLMRVRAASTDPGDAAVVAEAEARLRYWRGDPGAPMWRAQ